jgi:hypothetical protein
MFGRRLINTGGGVAQFDVANLTAIKYFSFTTGGDVYSGVWSPNGLNYYVQQYQGTVGIYQYSASVAYDVGTLSYSGNFSAMGAGYQPLSGVEISNDGVYFFTGYRIWNGSGFNTGVHRYTLTTPYNIATAGSLVIFYNSGINKIANLIRWSDDGTFFAVKVEQGGNSGFLCPTPYSLSGATNVYSGVTVLERKYDFTPDGLFVCWGEESNDNNIMTISQYELSTPFNLSTRGVTTSFNYNKSLLSPTPSTIRQNQMINFSQDGTKMYYLSGQGRVLVQFDTNVTF